MSKLRDVLERHVYQCSPEAGAALLTAITEAEAEITRLTRERAEAVFEAKVQATAADLHSSRAEHLRTERDEARSRALDEAAKAVKSLTSYGSLIISHHAVDRIIALKGDSHDRG